MYAKLLDTLQMGGEPFRLHDLEKILGASSETILDTIATLSEKGYGFQISKAAIKRVKSPDKPFPWEFSSRKSAIHYFEEIDSTMTEARRLAAAGAPDFTVVIAETQGKGRGRLDRKWVSSLGGLYFTIVLRPDIPPERSFLINFLSSLVLSQVLNDLFHVDARVKWPNDILIHEKKVAGMISEMMVTGNRIDYVNLGIGVNINNAPEAEFPHARSLKTLLGKPVSRVRLLGHFLDALEARMKNGPLDQRIISEWKKNSITIGREVRVETTQEVSSGTVVDVDEEGALILKISEGEIKRVIYGDCFLKD